MVVLLFNCCIFFNCCRNRH